jgi:hypothetical protein
VADIGEVAVEIGLAFEVTGDQAAVDRKCVSFLSHDHLISVLNVTDMFG